MSSGQNFRRGGFWDCRRILANVYEFCYGKRVFELRSPRDGSRIFLPSGPVGGVRSQFLGNYSGNGFTWLLEPEDITLNTPVLRGECSKMPRASKMSTP